MRLTFRSITVNNAAVGVEAIILGGLTSIGGFLFGYDTGLISGIQLFKDFIQRFGQKQGNGDVEFTPIILSLVVSLLSIGCMVGALSGA